MWLNLTASDEHELALTVTENKQEELQQKAAAFNVPLTLIGRAVAGTRIKCLDSDGQESVAILRFNKRLD